MMMVPSQIFSLLLGLLTLLYPFRVTFAFGHETTALLKWKATFKNQNNSLLASWQPGSDACNDWYGVSCINGRVNMLNITNASVFATLYDFPFSSLPFLEYLDHTMYNFSGTIPPEIGEVGYLRSLTKLSLGGNFLIGSIPASLGNLNNLSYLYLYDNQLSGQFLLGDLKNFNTLALYNNQLSGPIPSELGNLKSLNYLLLHNNQLSGPIPSELRNLKNPNHLVLSNNKNLFGPIPSELGNLKKLNNLELSDNQLSSPIPSVLGNLKNLNNLTLSNNQLTGSIPSSFENLRNLQTLFLCNNNFIEKIPSSICNLTSLIVLYLSRNNLKGKIPRSLENCKRVEVFDLGDNLLNDTFPMWLGTIPDLRVLSLRLNKLHGPIRTLGSESMYPVIRLLDLSSNAFTGNLPTIFFQHFRAMRKIDPSKMTRSNERYGYYYENSIAIVTKGSELQVEGHIPRIIGDLIALCMLYLSGLQGHIPPSLGRFEELIIQFGLHIGNTLRNQKMTHSLRCESPNVQPTRHSAIPGTSEYPTGIPLPITTYVPSDYVLSSTSAGSECMPPMGGTDYLEYRLMQENFAKLVKLQKKFKKQLDILASLFKPFVDQIVAEAICLFKTFKLGWIIWKRESTKGWIRCPF
ncbi:hypothetical protein P3S67_000005 [Capsicum chacoense]